jgi:hypothetical protein
MIKIIVTTTGFYVNKPAIYNFEYPEDTSAEIFVDNKTQKKYLRDLNKEAIQKWFEKEHLPQLPAISNRIISIQVVK